MSKGKAGRCTGHCCTNFHLPLSPEELMNSYHQWISQGQGSNKASLRREVSQGAIDPILHGDIHLIAPMVEYLGKNAPRPRMVNTPQYVGRGEYRYRCKHFNKKTRLCSIYEIRPWMCRYYPGPGGCNYAACTLKGQKQKKWEKPKRVKTDGELEDLVKMKDEPKVESCE